MKSPIASAIRNVVTRGLTAVAAFTRAGLAAPAQAHPDLSGLLAPLTGERTLEGLEVQGTIPPELDGRYLRIGPNPPRMPNAAAHR